MKREPIKSYDYEYIHRAVDILRKDPRRIFTVTELALEVNVNTFKLREGFKQLYKMTVYQFQSTLHLTMAKEMLEDTDLPIEEIAYKTGFGSRNSFTRRFNQVYRMPPRKWREIKESGESLPASELFMFAEKFCPN
jgi:transcriptional regulator GlxA family with amidase domain